MMVNIHDRVKRMKNISLLLLVCLWFAPGQSWSADDWYWQGRGQLLLKDYSGSARLDYLTGFGLYLQGDYLERGGFALGYYTNNTHYRSGSGGAPFEVNENVLFLSGRSSFTPDVLPGRLTLRLDGYAGVDEFRYRVTTPGPMGGGSSTRTTTLDDEITAVNPMVSFLNYAKTFYLDLGYAYSSYRSDDASVDDIDITQWTPTLGFGFNRAYDWLQLRGYLITLSNSNRVADKDEISALEAKWTHWFTAESKLSLHSLQVAVLAGERIYAIDSDACSLCNVPDLQKGAFSIAVEWKPGEQTSVLLQGGYETYDDLLLKDQYSSAYLYGHVSRSW